MTNELDEIQARADATAKRLSAWDERPDRVSFREFSAVDNGAIRVRTLHMSCESALLASAENANETIPKLVAALRAVEAVLAERATEFRKTSDRLNQEVLDRHPDKDFDAAQRYSAYAAHAEADLAVVRKAIREALT